MKKIVLLFPILFVAATLFAQTNLSNGLVAYYPLNGNFNDSSGHGHHGQSFGNMTFTKNYLDSPGKAAYFDGQDDYILIPADTSITPDSALTIALRFKTYTPSNMIGDYLISKSEWSGGNSSTSLQYQLGFNQQFYIGTPGIFLGTEHDGNCQTTGWQAKNYSFTDSVVQDSTWYCVVASFEKGVKRIFVNGNLIKQDTVTGQVSDSTIDFCPNGKIKLGAWWANDPQFLHGVLDEVRFYNRAITDAEVLLYCSNPKSDTLVDTPTVVSNVNKAASLLYPNPVKNILNIKSGSGNISDVAVFNCAGQQVLHMPANRSEVEVDVASFIPGVYYIKLYYTDRVETQKFIKE